MQRGQRPFCFAAAPSCPVGSSGVRAGAPDPRWTQPLGAASSDRNPTTINRGSGAGHLTWSAHGPLGFRQAPPEGVASGLHVFGIEPAPFWWGASNVCSSIECKCPSNFRLSTNVCHRIRRVQNVSHGPRSHHLSMPLPACRILPQLSGVCRTPALKWKVRRRRGEALVVSPSLTEA